MNTLTTSLDQWVANAKPGERVIVLQHPSTTRDKDAQRLLNAGLITLNIRRNPEQRHLWQLIATKLKHPCVDKSPLGRGSIGSAAGERKSKLKAETREKYEDVMRMVSQGMTQVEIAKRMGKSPTAVKKYVANARERGIE